EHLLLGLLRAEHGIVGKALTKMGVTPEAIRSEIGRLVIVGSVPPATDAIPYTPRAKKAIRLAAKEAKQLKHAQVGNGELFLGLLREGGGVAAMALRNLGVRLESAREAILKELK